MHALFVVVWSFKGTTEVLTAPQLERLGYLVSEPMGPETGPGNAGYRSVTERLGKSKNARTRVGTAVAMGARDYKALDFLDLGELVELTPGNYTTPLDAAYAAATSGGAVAELTRAGRIVAGHILGRLGNVALVERVADAEPRRWKLTELGRAALTARRDPRGLTPPPVGTQGKLFDGGKS